MIRLFFLITIAIFISSCSHSNYRTVAMSEVSSKETRSANEIKQIFTDEILARKNITPEQKESMISALNDGVDKSIKLKTMESKISQRILEIVTEPNRDTKELNLLKLELKRVYEGKYENFIKTVQRIKSNNASENTHLVEMINDFHPFFTRP